MRRTLTLTLLAVLFLPCFSQSLEVSSNNRYMQYPGGKPFLYLGDTGWELFHKLDREEATKYLENRSRKGFTVIQAVVLAELKGLQEENAYGQLPLIDMDPASPNEKYFEHVDFIVNKANELGMFVGLLPTWGDKVTNEHGGDGPVVFTPENARIYGEFLGERYKKNQMIWILGGDRMVTNDTVFNIWKQMAMGLQEGDGGAHLITYHPRGIGHSYYWFHHEDWFDFNMYQSGHRKKFNEVYNEANTCYMLDPVKPFIDGEPAYEDIGVAFWEFVDWSNPLKVPEDVLDKDNLIVKKSHFKKGWFNDYDVRVHAYWNLLSGACGYTYGNNAIWQMFEKGDRIVIPCLYTWEESLDRPGAFDMKHVKDVFLARPFNQLVPDQTVIHGRNQCDQDSVHTRAAIANDKSFLMAYTPVTQSLTINTGMLEAEEINAWWFNPRDGSVIEIGTFQNQKKQTFHAPTNNDREDWLLVIDDASANLKKLAK